MKEYTLSALKDLCERAPVKAFVERVQREYADKFEGKEIVTPSYLNYKRIALDGNRKAYEKEYFELRTRLAYLEVLAVWDDEYLADLEEVLSRICV